jgi:hypothetical protein
VDDESAIAVEEAAEVKEHPGDQAAESFGIGGILLITESESPRLGGGETADHV